METRNPLMSRWRDGHTTFGVWATMPGSVSAELTALAGVDYVCVDNQHGLIDHSTSVPMVQAIAAGGSVPIIRVPWNEPARIMSALDTGSLGAVVPMINDADDARRAVAAFRYPPRGQRSYGPVRAKHVLGSTDPSRLEDVACILMVETGDGLENVRDIAAVDGVDAIYVGPSDLSLALGRAPGSQRDETFMDALSKIRKACSDNGVVPGIQAANGEEAAGYVDEGFQMVTIGSDMAFLSASVAGHLSAARGERRTPAGASQY